MGIEICEDVDGLSRESARDDGSRATVLDGRGNSDELLKNIYHGTEPIRWKMWNPIWLSTISLSCFICLFAALVLALLLLWHYSNTHDGFFLISLNHYAWTYGPTAILVIIVSLWRQVDFYAKSLTPWDELRKGNATASKSLLLDYVSPIQALSLKQALGNRHVPVAATILGFSILKLVTLASTGLFMVAASQVPVSNVTLTAKTAMFGSSYNTTVGWGASTLSDTSVFYAAYGYITKGIPYPEGMKGNAVYPTFELKAFEDTNATVSAQINAFYPHFTCEVAEITVHNLPPNSIGDSVNITVTSPSCSIPSIGAQPAILVQTPNVDLVPSRQLAGQMQSVNCSGQELGDASTYSGAVTFYSEVNWQLLTIADVRYKQIVANGSFETSNGVIKASSWSTVIEKVAGIVCLPSYSMEKARVSYDLGQTPPRITVDGPLTRTNATLAGFSSHEMFNEFINVRSAAAQMFGTALNVELLSETQDPFLQTISQVAGGGYAALLNVTMLKEAAPIAFQTVVAQLIHKYLVTSSADSLHGQLLQLENRLRVRGFPMWVMIIGFFMLIALSILIIFCHPRDVVPRNPESIASSALVLAQSGGFQSLLEGSGRAKLNGVRKQLSSLRYTSRIAVSQGDTTVFKIEPTADWETTPPIQVRTTEWWRPFPVWVSVFSLIMLIPIILIAILEFLQRLSDRNNGVAALPSDNGLEVEISSRYLPALVMLMVATLYNSLDFTVSLFAPFHALKSGNATSSRSIQSSLVGKMQPFTLLAAVGNRHWGAVFSTIGALLGSLLTIVSSGLYTVDNVPVSRNVQLQRLDEFNTSWSNSAFNDSHAAVLTSLMENRNPVNPPFSSDELAFPALQGLDSSWEQDFADFQSPLLTKLPALRASLNCTVVPDAAVNVTGSFQINLGVSISVEARSPLPPDCLLGGPGRNLSYIDWTNFYDFGTSKSNYIGSMVDLHVGPWLVGWVDESSGELESPPQDDNPPGCPSLAFTFGYLKYELGDPVTSSETGQIYYGHVTTQPNLTTMICYQLMEEVQTSVTFLPPDFTVSVLQPPAPDEESVRYLESDSHGKTSFEYRPQSHLDYELSLFNQSQYVNEDQSQPVMDNFFQAVLLGKHPVDPAKLTGEANQGNLISAVQGFYRRYMAQAISINMRVKTLPTSSEVYTGTWQDPNAWRMKQNVVSKITLQVLLGIMFICGALAYSLTDMRHTLPHDPSSIAGVASLLAGSELCGEDMRSRMPDGVQWMSDKELKQNGVWEGWLFSMGWWEWKWGEQKRFGIDVGSADKPG